MAPKRGRPPQGKKKTAAAAEPARTLSAQPTQANHQEQNDQDGNPMDIDSTEPSKNPPAPVTTETTLADEGRSNAPPSQDADVTDIPSNQDSSSAADRGFTPINKPRPTPPPPTASGPAPATKKYQPKAVTRRTQEEREAFEREQNLRHSTSRGGSQVSRGQKRGRGGGDKFGQHRGRGRGGAGRGGGELRTEEASGIFGGPTVKEKVPRGPKPRSSALGRDEGGVEVVHSSDDEGGEDAEGSVKSGKKRTSTKVKKEDGARVAGAADKDDDGDVIMDSSKPRRKATSSRTTKTKIKEEEPQAGYMSDEARWDDDVGPKVEIAKISLLSDEDSEGSGSDHDGQRRRRSIHAGANMRPVRLEREEHREPDFGINTEASSYASAEIRRKRREHESGETGAELPDEATARIIDESSKVKRKPRDVDVVRVERRWKGVYDDSEEDAERPVKQEPRDDDDAMDLDDAPLEEQSAAAEAGSTRGRRASGRELLHRSRSPRYLHALPPDQEIALDEEDHELREMVEMVRKFGEDEKAAARDRPINANLDPIIHDLSDLKGDPSREGKMYLMQLPPIMPKLRDFSQPSPNQSTEPKLDTTVPNAKPSTSPSKKQTTIKPDPDTKTIPPHILHSDTVKSIRPPIGCPGTITFYKSGKVVTNWGGLELEVTQQRRAGFAQEILMHEWHSVNTKIEGKDQWEEVITVGSKAYALGEVEGGFVATPDLGSLLG